MIGASVRRAIGVGRVFACTALLVGCAQVISNDPINQTLAGNNPRHIEAELRPDVETNGVMVIALSFSGGGMRAAAFSYGVLTGMDETQMRSPSGTVSLLAASWIGRPHVTSD